MKRPPLEEVLRPLKPFQRRSVNHAFKQLFLTPEGSSRFLVADEVGLGKTMVARGIIARAIDHLWDTVDRIDIVYICSNQNIARANLPKLHMGHESLSSATRLTLLAKELASGSDGKSFLKSKLNFVSFTPSTSFEFGRSTGRRDEREVIYHLVKGQMQGRTTSLKNLLQGQVQDRDDWRDRLEESEPDLEPTIRKRFERALAQDQYLMSELTDTLNQWFKRYRLELPWEARDARNSVVGKLRRLLAQVSVKVLEPDLVILDEFQRFKPLMESREDKQTEAAQLAQSLFDVKAHDGQLVRTLLLSATPYKPYTSDAELGQEEHYEDFIETTRFLFNANQSKVEELKSQLADFGNALKRVPLSDEQIIKPTLQHKSRIEETLQSIMSRTERVPASVERDSMVKEVKPDLQVKPQDIKQYMLADTIFKAVGDQDPMLIWKSAPYLVHFMRGYKFNEQLEEAIEEDSQAVVDALSRNPKSLLAAETIKELKSLDPSHAKLRHVVREHLDSGMWRLLWLPPTLPYWPLEGPFKTVLQTTKTLMFSAWNVVPDTVSALVSYEAERRMLEQSHVNAYENLDKQQGHLLKFDQSDDGTRSSHRNLLMLLPCLPLSDLIHPLDTRGRGSIRSRIKSRISKLLDTKRLPRKRKGPVDNDWIWAAPVLLDEELRSFLVQWREGELDHVDERDSEQADHPDHFSAYLGDLIDFDVSGLGCRPPDLIEILTDVALGSPAILIARTLRAYGVTDSTRRVLAFELAGAFRKLFNRPAVISLLRSLGPNGSDSQSQLPYWRLVLNYCREGCLQAVLDEHWHLVWDQMSWDPDSNKDEVARKCATSLYKSIQPVPSRVHAHFFDTNNGRSLNRNEIRIRTVFALRFGHLSGEDEQKSISQDAIRNAFNSPFRPFLLASTSIGQEGLDFHPWCYRLIHWNLPGNPVDLEQREGRVHRYNGHAVRKNVAGNYAKKALENWKPGDDLWSLMFQYAERDARKHKQSDLVPHWIANGEHKIERVVPLLPYSKELAQFDRLKRQLVAYRVVFGQPRQEELLSILDGTGLSPDQLSELTIDLTPPTTQ